MPNDKPDRRRERPYEARVAQTLPARAQLHEVATLKMVAKLRACGWTVTPPTPATVTCAKCRHSIKIHDVGGHEPAND